ncbi:ROK family glucokinase [Alkalihalobacillus sp. MEB130]|uniref:ROK family glucokinase n=1 Tax=Alkalihalobacillus sp. MEB130 TaxID=2976704 RepID=UPI0028E02B9D|nr:ROK family glucokinase [Alkalihalobacillus sp. MEB130]MDT8859226.1 ROK family glucokinase [Alkalihalobacillus sp. MEB130]
MENKWLVGVDIGGTTIKMAFLNQEGHLVAKWEIATNIKENGQHIPKEIAQSIDEKLVELNEVKDKLIGIGIGAPGPVDFATGSIEVAVNLGWTDFPLKELLEKESGLPVTVDNDANIAALGEMWTGAGEGSNDLIFVTLGTGVGGGVISNGKIVHGMNGAGGEIGHITSIIEGGARCNCGKNGCLETIASATGIVRLAVEELKRSNEASQLRDYYNENNTVTAKLVLDAAKENDDVAKRVMEFVTLHLGLALANLANGLNPEKIVIGGGVSKAGSTLLNPIKEQFSRFAFPKVLGAEITIATLGNDAGVIGGAWLAKTKLGTK